MTVTIMTQHSCPNNSNYDINHKQKTKTKSRVVLPIPLLTGSESNSIYKRKFPWLE